MLTREALHRIVDELPEEVLDEAGRSLAELSDAVSHTLDTAPEDDEPLTEHERALLEAPWPAEDPGFTTAQVRILLDELCGS